MTTQPSELLRQGVRALRVCAADPHYVLNTHVTRQDFMGKRHVWLAGAWLDKRDQMFDPGGDVPPGEVTDMALALDAFGLANISRGLWYCEPPGSEYAVSAALDEYTQHVQPWAVAVKEMHATGKFPLEAFCASMEDICKYLEKHNL